MGNIAYPLKGHPYMPDYKEMYLHLMRETEKAIRILTQAQQACETIYLDTEEPQLFVLPKNLPDTE